MGDDHYYTHAIFSKQKVRLLTCSFHEVDSTACGKVTEAMLVPTRSTCTQPLLEGTAGYCACAGAVGSREWRGDVNVSCDHDASLLPPRLRPRAARGHAWHPSDEEVRDAGQRAARHRAQLAARSLDRPAATSSAREAIVFTTRILDASMTNCTKDNLASLARTVPRTTRVVVLAERGCAPSYVAAEFGGRVACVLGSSLRNVSSGAWELFNGKSGLSKGGFIRWLAVMVQHMCRACVMFSSFSTFARGSSA